MKKAFVRALDAEDLDPGGGRHPHHAANRGVHPGRIATRGKHGDFARMRGGPRRAVCGCA